MPDDDPTRARRRTARSRHTALALAELSASLADVDWRLLQWMLRYPLQRVDDLVVGVARWASHATVYRHVQALEEHGLLESVLPKTPGVGKRLYYLSNAGLHMLAGHQQRPARELARGFQADEAGLLRLLPRLPTLLVLQDVVNGLITHAAEAVTSGGRRPRLVRWTWQRDVAHRFQYREQVTRMFVDGAVALCIRTLQMDASTLDQWFGLFILSTELDDERLMRLRLERLLCWRESPERWSCYQHMPPVLILARSPHQREHWQHAVEAAALKLRLAPLVGAVACLSSAESAHVNPWSLPWRTLSIDQPCHLREQLRPLPRTALPPSLYMEEGGVVGESNTQAPSSNAPTVGSNVSGATPVRFSRLIVGGLAQRVVCITGDVLEEQEVIALLGLRLTPGQWSTLRLLLAHPLLSDEELAAFLNFRRPSAQALCWWETGPRCERRYQVNEQWYNLRPDALASYRVGQQQRRFWLEWDQGTMNVRDLSIKFTAYAHYVATREWARESARLPTLLCIAPDITQERRMHRVAQARLTPPCRLAVWTTTEALLNEHGPLAPIWLQGVPQDSQAAKLLGSHRQYLSEVMSGEKGI